MEANAGSQQALQIAFQTLKERCRQFQQHIATLEAENIQLRSQQPNQNDSDSLSELDTLKRRITELVQEKTQLQCHLKIVTEENQQLWSKLSKLTEVNKSLGTHLTRINDTLSQHSSKQPVIRSKTFTIENHSSRVQQKNLVDENEKVSLELEDISLKLISNIAKEKKELEIQCSQMMEIQSSNIVMGSVLGTSGDSESEPADKDIDKYLESVDNIKCILFEEKDKLVSVLQNLQRLEVEGKIFFYCMITG